MLVFVLIASFSASLVYPMQALIEEEKTLTYQANLTGTIDDEGIDADDSGKFDYLKISVEVDVSVAGEYIVNVDGLSADTHLYISVSDTKREYLTLGMHMVDIYLYGPVIYQFGLNPTYASSISLQSVRFEQFVPQIEDIDYIYDIPLSQEYHYIDFDAPFSDVEEMFTVYPNGSVVLSGVLNYTHMIPYNPGPEVYGTVDITRNGDLTVASADCTFVVPPEVASRIPVELPIDTTEVSYQEQYSDTQFSTDLSVNMTLPPWLVSEYPFNTTDLSLLEAYSEGIGSMEMSFTTIVPESIRSMFPFNLTDVTITGQYIDEQLTGSITFHVISGLPIFDLDVDFEGNRTYLSLTGEGLVIYGDYPAIDFSIDQETLEGILMDYNSTLPGKGLHSLYDETYGILECTHLNTTLTPYDGTGASVDFGVGIRGDFVELIAYIVAQSAPPDTSEQVHDIIYEALSTLVDSVESVDLQIAYVHDSGEAEIGITFVNDVRYLISSLAEIAEDAMTLDDEMAAILAPIISAIISLNASLPYISEAQTQLTYSSTTGKLQLRATSSGEIAPEEYYYYPTYPLPEEMPPEFRELFELLQELFEELQETRLCNVTFYNLIFTYGDSIGNVRVECALEGDLNAQVNFVKDFIVPYMNLPSSVELFLNETLIDLLGLQMSFNLGSTTASGELTGLMLSPPIDPINATCFKLESFFSLASKMGLHELLGEGGNLKITIGGGSNITHAITLFRPPTVPEPTETTPDLRRMVWYNQSLSDLKDMEFRIQTQAYDATILVTDQGDNPIPNAAVNLYYPNGTLYKSLVTDDYGYTEATHVDYRYMPSGLYNFTATYMGVSAATPLTIGYTGTYIIKIAMKGPQVVETVAAPQLVDATENAATILNITEISKPVEIIVRNVTAPEDVELPPGTWKVLGNYVQIMANETEITVSATMRIYYTTEQLSAAGLDESTLEIRFWNVTTGEWEPIESYVNTEEHYVWAITDHFSFFAIMGQPTAPIWTQFWFLAIVSVVIIVVIVASAFSIRRQKTAITTNKEP